VTSAAILATKATSPRTDEPTGRSSSRGSARRSRTRPTEGAIARYREAIRIRPEHAPAHLNLGFALIGAGDVEAGQEELDRAVELDPTLASRIPEGTLASPEPESDRGEPVSSP